MRFPFIRTAVLAAAFIYIGDAAAQDAVRPEARLRFDEARREEAADAPCPACGADTLAAERPFAFKLNRRRVAEAAAYDAVTLWNVRRVKAKNRRMRLSDSTRREKVRLLKFFTGRDPKKGQRPHLLGNVAGYTWSEAVYDESRRTWRKVRKHIAAYTLRNEYDSACRAGGGSGFHVPAELWHTLPPDAVYILDGEPVPGTVFQFIDGLILRTLEIHTDTATVARYGARRAVVVGDIYPDRIPLVVFNGTLSSIGTWLKMCRSDAFSMSAEVPMHYFYMLPVEAVQTYGVRGKYGAIRIDVVQ